MAWTIYERKTNNKNKNIYAFVTNISVGNSVSSSCFCHININELHPDLITVVKKAIYLKLSENKLPNYMKNRV